MGSEASSNCPWEGFKRFKQETDFLTLIDFCLTHTTVKVRDVLKLLKNDGWLVVVTVGSHRQMKHPIKSGRVTVAGHPSDDIHPKTLKSILTQAGLNK